MVRVLIERRCVAPLTLNDDDDLGDYEGSLRKLSYLKLPQTRLKLSVLKLDGSLFGASPFILLSTCLFSVIFYFWRVEKLFFLLSKFLKLIEDVFGRVS